MREHEITTLCGFILVVVIITAIAFVGFISNVGSDIEKIAATCGRSA